MSRHEDLVEEAIRLAIERGEFDDLPGQGKPLELGEDDPAWWARRQVERMRRSDAALEAAQRTASRIDSVWALPDVASVRARVAEINREIDDVNKNLDEEHRLDSIDPERAVATWQRMYRLRA